MSDQMPGLPYSGTEWSAWVNRSNNIGVSQTWLEKGNPSDALADFVDAESDICEPVSILRGAVLPVVHLMSPLASTSLQRIRR